MVTVYNFTVFDIKTNQDFRQNGKRTAESIKKRSECVSNSSRLARIEELLEEVEVIEEVVGAPAWMATTVLNVELSGSGKPCQDCLIGTFFRSVNNKERSAIHAVHRVAGGVIVTMNSGGAKMLKPKCVLAGVTLLPMICVTSASAASREIEYFCLEQAQQATLPHRRGAGEAFMANCIASLTPTPTKKRRILQSR